MPNTSANTVTAANWPSLPSWSHGATKPYLTHDHFRVWCNPQCMRSSAIFDVTYQSFYIALSYHMQTPRDLTTSIESTAYEVGKDERSAAGAIRRASQEPDEPHQYSLLDVPKHLARGLLQRYARGDSIDSLRQYFHEAYRPALEEAVRLRAKFFPAHVYAYTLNNQLVGCCCSHWFASMKTAHR